MDGEVVLSPAHPPKSTAAAYNVYPFSGGRRRPRCHSRRSPFFGALTTARNSGTPAWNARCIRVYAGGWRTRPRMTPGGTRAGRADEDGRKFATGSLMSLKQKTPPPILLPVSLPTSCRARGVGPFSSFLPSFVPHILSLLSLQHLRKTSAVFESRPSIRYPHSPVALSYRASP